MSLRALGWFIFSLIAWEAIVAPRAALAQEAGGAGGFLGGIEAFVQSIVDVLNLVFYFKIGGENGFPFIVLWLVIGAIFFTLRLRFINVRAFKHAIDVVRGKYDSEEDEGDVSHFQALAAALSGTVGIGNIAGVAIAIRLGGPGAAFWMTMAGFLGMSSKLAECTLGQKYRVIKPDGTVGGGPMYSGALGHGDGEDRAGVSHDLCNLLCHWEPGHWQYVPGQSGVCSGF